MSSMTDLLKKYNVQGPRYTSYPTVPYWEDHPDQQQWIEYLSKELNKSQTTGHGAAIYIHIPFCEQLCTFCACNKIITKKHERSNPYIKAVHQEWQIYLKELGRDRIPVSEVHLGGGTPTFLTPDELKQLMGELLPHFDILAEAEMSFEADPRVTTPDHLQALYDLGFRRMSYGIQDFDPVVQDVINRVQSVAQVTTLTQAAREIGYTSVNYDLVYGLPLQTLKSIEDTIAHVRDLKPDRIAFYAYAHVPWVGKTGQRKFTEADLPDGDAKRALYELGREMLFDAGYREIGLDHFALPEDDLTKAASEGRLFRNFMGYMAHHVSPLIGLGVSSISDAWRCYVQNTKDLNEYQENVAQGILPIIKGHVLTKEDEILRRHILNLMTQFQTDWNSESEFTDYLIDVPDKLQEFANDNLIQMNDNKIMVPDSGRPFLRNICMAFDARLERRSPQQQIFSKTI